MPERQSAAAGASAAEDAATTTLLSLPHAVIVHIFSLLPVDVRLRCAEVCRGWRTVLLERSLWTRLELTAASGVTLNLNDERGWDSLLRCAAARAGGALHSLRIDASLFEHAALLQVAAANAGALRELHVCEQHEPRSGISPAEAEALLLEAPLLEVLDTALSYDSTVADVGVLRAALRNAAPFGALRVRRLHADLAVASAAEVVALAADVAAHAALHELTVEEARLGAGGALDAVVDAALAGRLESVCFLTCGFPPPPACAPSLARLLRSEALTTLEFSTMHFLDAITVEPLSTKEDGSAGVLLLCRRAAQLKGGRFSWRPPFAL